jgi:hypothetical protein
VQNTTSQEADQRRQEENSTEPGEDSQSHIISGTSDGSEFNAKLSALYLTIMLPTNGTTTSTDVRPEHDTTTVAQHCIIPAKTIACSSSTLASKPEQRR